MGEITRILSIDGGGIRGIIAGEVLVSVEKKLQARTGNPDARIADCFDLVAGTSTGGILTCVLLCPGREGDPTRPRYTAEEAVDLYLKKGDAIFDVSVRQRLRSVGGLVDEKYRASALEGALDEYLLQTRLSELLKPCLITAYDITGRRAVFFTQIDAKEKPMHDFYLKDVARATSAAPTYFEVAEIQSLTNVPYPLVDGGVFANNPSLCAYAEVRRKFENHPTATNMAILSLGTGYVRKQYSYQHAKDWGAIQWIKPLIDLLMAGVSETVDYQLAQIFDSVDKSAQYLRINGELRFAKPEMDDASPENLTALKQDGIRIAEEHDSDIDEFIDYLL